MQTNVLHRDMYHRIRVSLPRLFTSSLTPRPPYSAMAPLLSTNLSDITQDNISDPGVVPRYCTFFYPGPISVARPPPPLHAVPDPAAPLAPLQSSDLTH